MSYSGYYCNRRHLSLVVKTQNETYEAGVLTCPAEGPDRSCSSSTSEMTDMYPCFSLAQSSSFFLSCCSSSVCLFFLFDVGDGGTCFCCCCLFSSIAYSLSLNVSDQVRADTAPEQGRGAAAGEGLTLLRHAPWL